MTNAGEYNDLDPILLQAEQNFFEKSEEEIMRLEQDKISQDHLQEQQNIIRLLRLQLLQAQEEIGLSTQRLNDSLQQVKDARLQTKQLNQVQEELSAALDIIRGLQEWQHIHRTSIISQLKMIIKTLASKLRNKVVWLIPLNGARKGKALLKRFTQRNP